MRRAGVKLIWFDSMGAKSMSVFLSSGVIIDPGAAAMQPSYPLPDGVKADLRERALREIARYLRLSKAVFVTHYHYDHIVNLAERREFIPLLRGKAIYMKNPNKYINESQWVRSRALISSLIEGSEVSLSDLQEPPGEDDFPDPVEELKLAFSRDYGSYASRREEVLEKGRKWFSKISTRLWGSKEWLREFSLYDGTRVRWADGRTVNVGDTTIKVLKPWFHGIEYARTGWVTPLIIDREGVRVFYTSDVMGPEIEDYSSEIIKARPDAVILDGPPTYLYPYLLSKVNMMRAIENAINIIEGGDAKIIIYDHHLLRDCRWRSMVSEVFKAAEKSDVTLLTAAEYLGNEPLIDKACISRVKTQ